ncbi:hypothetical protein BS47DRAFT_1379161 [Hydnum rufescens UP504]|uniref:Uncharacterized protein n=1 Tax=Hydnum rufescens UP504 TaxID=1448309 RepID=A0A9P6B993_9AGAM|nr:hypothetical protein BS47DRAFT_1379161 [Hydnum rufescens UP504]
MARNLHPLGLGTGKNQIPAWHHPLFDHWITCTMQTTQAESIAPPKLPRVYKYEQPGCYRTLSKCSEGNTKRHITWLSASLEQEKFPPTHIALIAAYELKAAKNITKNESIECSVVTCKY